MRKVTTIEGLQNIYFVGIGGIGMSAIARYFQKLGKKIYGYDRTETPLTKALAEEGIEIHYQDDVKHIPQGIDLVIYTPAIPAGHKELNYFIDNDYAVMKRSEILGIISREKRTVAVAGTHGKTTTSTMVSHLLREGGIACSSFLGGISVNLGSNFVFGDSDWVVVEADEFDRSFHRLSPEISVITSLDPDHLDIYGDNSSIKNGYVEFALKIINNGTLILHEDIVDEVTRHQIWIQADKKPQVTSYGALKGAARYRYTGVKDGKMQFDYLSASADMTGLMLDMPGLHNIENATAAITVALMLGISEDKIREGISTFKGIKRRFETVYETDRMVLIDDYAHHPTELRAAISAAKAKYPGRKITGIFQPHLFSRTRDFAEGFAAALDMLDTTYLLDIYPARELPMEGIDSRMLLGLMKSNNKRLIDRKEIPGILDTDIPEVLLILGAGDIDKEVSKVRDWMKKADQ